MLCVEAMIGLEQWRASIGEWYARNLSAIYRRHGSRRITRNYAGGTTFLNFDCTTALRYLLIIGLFGATSWLCVHSYRYLRRPWILEEWRADPQGALMLWRHGMFEQPSIVPIFQSCCICLCHLWMLASPSAPMLRLLLAISWLLIMSGDVELNPGPLQSDLEKLLQTVNTSVLVEDDLFAAFSDIVCLSPQWKNIGLALGLLSSDIGIIETAYHCKPEDCLREVILRWLKLGYNVDKHGPPTWKKIVQVTVEPAAGNDPALGEKLAIKHQLGVASAIHIGSKTERTDTGSCTESHPDPRETHDLCKKFASAFRKITKLINDTVEIEGLKDFLYGYSHLLYPDENYVNPKVFKDAKTPRDLLRLLTPQFINYMNYYLLEDIVDEFECTEGKQILEDYKSIVNPAIRKRKLNDFPDPVFDNEIEQFWGVKKAKVTVARDFEHCTMELMQNTQTALQTATGISKTHIVYASHDPGSVILNFLIPESICHVFHDLCTEDLVILADVGIYRLEIDDYVMDNIQKSRTKKTALVQTSHTRNAGVNTKQSSLEFYFKERQEMQSNQNSHLFKMLGSITDKELDQVCSDYFFSVFAKELRNWKKLAPYFGLPEWSAQELVDRYPDESDQKYEVLQYWKRYEGGSATYRNLLETLLLHGYIEEVEAFLYHMGPEQQKVMKNKQNKVFVWQLYSGFIPVEKHHKYYSAMLSAGCLSTISKSAHCSYEAGQPAEIKMDFKNLVLSGLDMHHLMFSRNVIPEIKFRGCVLGSDALLHLWKVYSLQSRVAGQSLSITFKNCTLSTEGLLFGRTLQELRFPDCKIGDEGTKVLAKALTFSHSITILNLSGNEIGVNGVRALAESLWQNISLEELILQDNEIGDYGASALAKSLWQINFLKELNLACNRISATGSVALSKALHHNTSLQKLNLSGNHIGAEGAAALGGALTVNTSLEILNLSGNHIGAEGATALGRALTVNTSLEILNLSETGIGDPGVTVLAWSLSNTNCKFLKELNLADNLISSSGSEMLCKALHHNTTLQKLNLERNFLSNKDGEKFGDVLRVNMSLKKLMLGSNYIDSKTRESLLRKFPERLTFVWYQIDVKEPCDELGNPIFSDFDEVLG